jgi:hypothetical protein
MIKLTRLFSGNRKLEAKRQAGLQNIAENKYVTGEKDYKS